MPRMDIGAICEMEKTGGGTDLKEGCKEKEESYETRPEHVNT